MQSASWFTNGEGSTWRISNLYSLFPRLFSYPRYSALNTLQLDTRRVLPFDTLLFAYSTDQQREVHGKSSRTGLVNTPSLYLRSNPALLKRVFSELSKSLIRVARLMLDLWALLNRIKMYKNKNRILFLWSNPISGRCKSRPSLLLLQFLIYSSISSLVPFLL